MPENELRVLVVDDEPDVLLGLTKLARTAGAEVRVASCGEEALQILSGWTPHLVLSDITMGEISGLDLLDEIRQRLPFTRVVLITGFGTIESAVGAMHRGASHFITKPFDNEEILSTIRRFGAQALVDERIRDLRSEEGRAGARSILVVDARMREVLDLVDQVAPTPVTVLIEGESGSGKELVARTLHERSPRRGKPFLAVNTGALPDPLLESELFGHVRGAFTGALRDRKGIFEQVRGGTVLLDEIGLMSPAFQGKLLRVLQERTVVPLGTSRSVPVDFRLVAATSRSLRDGIAEATFREDLYYRLRVVTIHIPPLRERRDDIVPLATHFLSKYAGGIPSAAGVTPLLAPAAIEELHRREWPGHVRELENSMQRALVLSGGLEIRPEHLGLDDEEGGVPGRSAADLSYEEGKHRAVQRFQRRYVENALQRAGGNVTRAAQVCGLTRAALQRIMRSLGLERARFVPKGGEGGVSER